MYTKNGDTIGIDEYKSLMEYLKNTAVSLNKHERAFCECNPQQRDIKLHDIVITNIPITLCHKYPEFYLCSSLRFDNSIELYESQFQYHHEMFVNGDAQSILDFLYSKSEYPRSEEDYIDYLRSEACCYIVERKNKSFGKVLRIDLFRMAKKVQENLLGKEFVGGLFHVLKHFAIDGHNLCNGKDMKIISSINHLVYLISIVFIQTVHSIHKTSDAKITNSTTISEGVFTIVLFKECETNVYFLKSFRAGQ